MHAQNGTIQEDVLSAGQFGVKTGANFKQRANSTAQFAVAFGGVSHARKNFEQSALPGAVSADDTQSLTLLDVKTDIAQCPDFFFLAFVVAFTENIAQVLHLAHDQVAQGILPFLECADLIALANAPDDNRGIFFHATPRPRKFFPYGGRRTDH